MSTAAGLGLAGVRDGFQVHADGFRHKPRKGSSPKAPPPGEVTVTRRCAPSLWAMALRLAAGEHSRITVHSWADVSVLVRCPDDDEGGD